MIKTGQSYLYNENILPVKMAIMLEKREGDYDLLLWVIRINFK